MREIAWHFWEQAFLLLQVCCSLERVSAFVLVLRLVAGFMGWTTLLKKLAEAGKGDGKVSDKSYHHILQLIDKGVSNTLTVVLSVYWFPKL
jgi:hypothetical protein